MNKKLKALGLALVAALALSGVVAMAAQAETVIKSELAAPAVTSLDVVDATGKEHGKLSRLTVGNGARFIECTHTKVLSNVTIVGSATTLTATPTHEECFSNSLTSVPVTFTHNGCTLTMTATKASVGDVTIDCPKGGKEQMEVHLYENEKAHKEGKALCTYDIKPQTRTGSTITTGGAAGKTHDLTLDLSTLGKLKMTNTGPGGAVLCGIAVGAEGEGGFSGKLTLSGTDSKGTAVGITLE